MILAQTNNNILRLGSWCIAALCRKLSLSTVRTTKNRPGCSWSIPTTWKLESTDEHTTSKSRCLAELGHSQKNEVKEVVCARYILPFRYWAPAGRHCNWRRTQWHKLSLSLALFSRNSQSVHCAFQIAHSKSKQHQLATQLAKITLKNPILLGFLPPQTVSTHESSQSAPPTVVISEVVAAKAGGVTCPHRNLWHPEQLIWII